MTRLAFGEGASWYERRIPDCAAPLVVFELRAIERALPAMVALRLQTGSLAIAPLIEAPRSALVERLADAIFAQHREPEARAVALRAYAQGTLIVSGRSIREIGPYDPRDLAQLREAIDLADRMIVSTHAAAVSIEALAATHAAEVVVLEPPQREYLAPTNGVASVVIWDRTGSAAIRGWFAFALRGCAAEVIVAGPGEEAKLVSARVVVLTDVATPLEAWRVSTCGAALVVDRLCGAHEWLAGTIGFDRADSADIARAVRAAWAAAPPVARGPIPSALTPAQPRELSAPTAIVVRTRDRPALLERSLASLAAQTYGALRTIVINDGGASVADLVAQFPRTSLIERSQSDFRTAANEAVAATTEATYVGLLDDDDAIAPTHVWALVDALERSGSDLAVCGAVHVFVPAPDDLRITAYAIFAAPAFERSALLIGNLIPGALRVLVRRAAMAAVEGFNPDLSVAADYELWLRLSRASDVVRVAGVNAAYTVFANRANRSLAPGVAQRDALRTIYALHPVNGRARLIAARATMLAAVERAGGYPLVAPTRLLHTPLSLREKSFQG